MNITVLRGYASHEECGEGPFHIPWPRKTLRSPYCLCTIEQNPYIYVIHQKCNLPLVVEAWLRDGSYTLHAFPTPSSPKSSRCWSRSSPCPLLSFSSNVLSFATLATRRYTGKKCCPGDMSIPIPYYGLQTTIWPYPALAPPLTMTASGTSSTTFLVRCVTG